MSIYKACDIRGKFGVELNTGHAQKLGQALAGLLGPVPVVVGGDARLSTPALQSALVESLVRAGCRVVDLGRVSTPLFYFARQKLGIDAGVMVTASHNPAADNGFKITLGPLPVTQDEMDALARRMESDLPALEYPGGSCTRADLWADYLAFAGQFIPDLAGMRVVVDCSNGMAGAFARQVWERTGAAVNFLAEAVDGSFPAHAPNPAEVKNLAALQQTVRVQGANLGVAYDGDADRVVFVDEKGRPLESDRVIVLFAREMLRQGPAPIVYDQKCSRVVADWVRRLGGEPVMELSGHTYIKRAFLNRNAPYAGELSGHHFFRRWGGDDGLLASLLFAELLRESGKPLSVLAAEIPAYPITPDLRVPMSPAEIQQLLSDLETNLRAEAAITRTDGVRIEYPDGWGLVRPSVTEPVVTMRFEGVDEASLRRILECVKGASSLLSSRSLQF